MKKQKLSIVLGSIPRTSSDPLNQEDVFYPGDVVAGMVTFNPTSNFKYCCIKIRFTGTVETKVSKTQDQVYVINQQSVLMGNANHESEHVLNEGEYAWPFEFALPMQHIPSAGKYRHGSVKYALTAIVTSKGFMGGMQEQKTIKHIQIHDLINCTAAPYSDPVQSTVSFNLKPKTNKSKNLVSATVKLEQAAFLPGQHLNVQINFTHPAGFSRDPACWIQLVRKEKYQAGENIKELSQVLAQSSHAIKIDHEDKTGFIKTLFEIPKDSLFTTSTTKIMTIQHHLFILFDMRTKTGMFEGRNPNKATKKLRAKLKDIPGGLETEIPITIGTLADTNHAPRVAIVTTPTAESITSPSVTASTLGVDSSPAQTPITGSTSSIQTEISRASSTPITATLYEPPTLPSSQNGDCVARTPSLPRYTAQAELQQAGSSSSSPSRAAITVQAAAGKSRHAVIDASPTTTSDSVGSPPRSIGASSFSLQPIYHELPEYPPTSSGFGASSLNPINSDERRSVHPAPSIPQSIRPLPHPVPLLTTEPHFHPVPPRRIQHMTLQGRHNPSSASQATAGPSSTPLHSQFYSPTHLTQVSQAPQPSWPSQPFQTARPPQSSVPPLLPRFLSAGEPSRPSQPPQLSQSFHRPETHGAYGAHVHIPQPTAVSNGFNTPRPPFASSRTAFSVPLVAAPGHANSSTAIHPPSPPPKDASNSPPTPPPKEGASAHPLPTAAPPLLTAQSQYVPKTTYQPHPTNNRMVPGVHSRQGRPMPRAQSSPNISNGYADANGRFLEDRKSPPSPAPMTIDPPLNVSLGRRESPTAPRAIDLGYGPASPTSEGLPGGGLRSLTSQTSLTGAVIVPPATISPPSISSGGAMHLQRYQAPVGDYFTATSLAPAPAPTSAVSAVSMAAASAPRFSLVFGRPSSAGSSTPTSVATASMAAPSPPAALTASVGHAGMMVMTPTQEYNRVGAAPPYAPLAANGHRTV